MHGVFFWFRCVYLEKPFPSRCSRGEKVDGFARPRALEEGGGKNKNVLHGVVLRVLPGRGVHRIVFR